MSEPNFYFLLLLLVILCIAIEAIIKFWDDIVKVDPLEEMYKRFDSKSKRSKKIKKSKLEAIKKEGVTMKKRFLILEANCEVFSSNPFVEAVGATARMLDEETRETYYLSCVEINGIAKFYKSSEDILSRIAAGEISDEFEKLVTKSYIDSFEGYNLRDEYDGLFDSIFENGDSPASDLLRYVVDLTRCEIEKEVELKAFAGKYIEDVDVPLSDVEEDYVEDHS